MLFVYPQANDFAIETGDMYFELMDYDAAEIEYKRFLFINKNSSRNHEVFKKQIQCQILLKKWDEAIETMNYLYKNTRSDSIKNEILIDKTILLMAADNIDKAEITLNKILMFSSFSNIKKRGQFLLGVCNLYKYKWKEAKYNFNQYFNNKYRYELDEIFELTDHITIKKMTIARNLSIIIPGLGQIYSKDYKNGINALLLNLSTSYLLLNSIYLKDYLDAFIIYLTPFERYYLGNIANTKRIVEEYNENQMKVNSNLILDKIKKLGNTRESNKY